MFYLKNFVHKAFICITVLTTSFVLVFFVKFSEYGYEALEPPQLSVMTGRRRKLLGELNYGREYGGSIPRHIIIAFLSSYYFFFCKVNIRKLLKSYTY